MTNPPQGSDERGESTGSGQPGPSHGGSEYGRPEHGGSEYGRPAQPPQPPPGSDYSRPTQPYGPPGYGPPAQPYGPPGQTYGQPAQPYGQPAQPYGQPAQPYGQPGYGLPGEPYGRPPYGQPWYEQPAGPPAKKSKAPLIAVIAGIVVLLAAGAVVLAFALRSTVLDPRSVERDVAGQFEEREGVAIELDCADDMPVDSGASYDCTGTTADGEEVTLQITVTDEDQAAYTWTEP
jgi:hypothetical protein